jgi:hypothetical protein
MTILQEKTLSGKRTNGNSFLIWQLCSVCAASHVILEAVRLPGRRWHDRACNECCGSNEMRPARLSRYSKPGYLPNVRGCPAGQLHPSGSRKIKENADEISS